MKKIRNGLLIILEGGEGVGKTTQAKALIEYYNSKGYSAKYFREPGGNELCEQLRNLMLYNEMDVTTETLLMSATRNINVKNNILPALLDGNIVILDRFSTSTLVYQGFLKNEDLRFINECTMRVTEDLYDNDACTVEITLLCDAKIAMERAKAEGHERNKHDVLPIEDYEKINNLYLDLFIDPKYNRYKNPNCSYHMINTTDIPEQKVFDDIVLIINEYIKSAELYEE